MNKFEKISVMAIASLALLGTTVFGTTGKVYNTSQGLVLRGEASKSGAPLATIANDTEVEIIENLGEWYKVNANGQEGYLFAEYVKVQEAQEVPETPTEVPPAEENPNNENKKAKYETKIYIMPVITSSTIGTIPVDAEVKTEKILNNWSYISYENIKGWIRTYNINEKVIQTPEEEKPENNPEEQTEQPTEEPTKPEENTNLSFTKGYINSSSVNVRSQPNTSSEIVTTLILNTGVSIIGQTDEWYKVAYGDYLGYIYKPLISETPTATSRGNEIRQPENTQEQTTVENNEQTKNEAVAPAVPSNSVAGEKIVSFAKQYLGYPYVWGGTTPSGGFDCSGFVYYVFNSCGYSLSRSCTVQANSGTAVSKANLQPGDVIFFNNTSNGSIGHVGIYIGDGKFIHAANSRRGVVTDTINSGYYYTYYYSARRIAN